MLTHCCNQGSVVELASTQARASRALPQAVLAQSELKHSNSDRARPAWLDRAADR